MRFLALLLPLCLLLVVSPVRAELPTTETTAREALLIDATTNTVLLAKNADQRMPPSSMSKLMTMYAVFDALRDGKIALDDTATVSELAWKQEGSRMFLEPGMQVKIEDLIRGVIVQSGNDACVALAEAISGSVGAFAGLLNETAARIGLTGSHFTNASGLPEPDHYMTPHDLVVLSMALIKNFPEHYHYFSEKEFTFNKIKQGNRNPLLYRSINVDGLKTGHAEEAGYGIAVSALQDSRRLVLVVNGLKDMQERADEAARLLEWGFREFGTYTLFKAGDQVGDAGVWLGQMENVPLVVDEDYAVTLPRAARGQLSADIEYQQPIAAPIQKGQKIGMVKVSAPGMTTIEIPLTAALDIPKLGWFSAIATKAKYVLAGDGK